MADLSSDQTSKLPDNKSQVETTTTPAKAKKATTVENNPANKPRTGLLWFLSLLNLLLVLGLTGGAFWAWQQYQAKMDDDRALSDRLSATNSSVVKQLQAQEQNVNEQLRGLNTTLENIESEIASNSTLSQSNSNRLADLSGRRPSDWLLAEADYLVRMAGRKLWLENDVRTAVLMLESADARLQDMADPSLLAVRQYIANDLQVLRQLNQVSTINIALAVSAIVKQIDALPLALPEIPEVTDHNVALSEDISDAGTNLQKTLSFFKDLFQYRPKDTPIRPLLTTQQQWVAREQLKLALQQAQSAAIAHEGELYQQSLQTAISILVDHYDLTNEAVVKFTESLRNLEQTDLRRTLPRQLQSAQPLSDALAERVTAAHHNEAFKL